MKMCKGCQKDKLLTDYNRHSSTKDKLNPKCKKCMKTYIDTHYQQNKQRISLRNKKYRETNGEMIRERSRKKYCPIKQREASLRHKSKPGVRRKQSQYNIKKNKERYNEDPHFAIIYRIRRRLQSAIKVKKWYKNTEFKDYIGCDKETLTKHIESQFTKGMNWDNRSLWHIDHIIPLSSAINSKELYKLSHYTNLQPLWATDNLKKSDKIV